MRPLAADAIPAPEEFQLLFLNNDAMQLPRNVADFAAHIQQASDEEVLRIFFRSLPLHRSPFLEQPLLREDGEAMLNRQGCGLLIYYIVTAPLAAQPLLDRLNILATSGRLLLSLVESLFTYPVDFRHYCELPLHTLGAYNLLLMRSISSIVTLSINTVAPYLPAAPATTPPFATRAATASTAQGVAPTGRPSIAPMPEQPQAPHPVQRPSGIAPRNEVISASFIRWDQLRRSGQDFSNNPAPAKRARPSNQSP